MSTQGLGRPPRYPLSIPVEVRSGSRIQMCVLTDIAVGGAFVRTIGPAPIGSVVCLIVETPELALDAIAEVRHVVENEAAQKTGHAPGMGVQFNELSNEARETLDRYLTNAARKTRGDESVPAAWSDVVTVSNPVQATFTSPTHVQVIARDRVALTDVWLNQICKGGFFVETHTLPNTGTRVDFELVTPAGPVHLKAEVVHVVTEEMSRNIGHPAGAGLQMLDLDRARREEIERFLADGSVPLGKSAPSGAGHESLDNIMATVKRMFAGIDAQDVFSALGVPADASKKKALAAIEALRSLVEKPHPQATAAQQTRIAGAARAIPRLEKHLDQALLARERKKAPPPPRRPVEQSPVAREKSRMQMSLDLADRADVAERQRDFDEASRLIDRAVALWPDPTMRQRRVDLRARIERRGGTLPVVTGRIVDD